MFRKSLSWISIVLILTCGLFVFTACNTGSTDTTKSDAEKVDSEAVSMEDTVKKVVDSFKDDLSKLDSASASATGEEAAALKAIADHETTDIDDAEKHIEEDVKNDKLTKEAADTAKSDLDSLKTSFKDLSTKLESAAAGATAKAEDLAEGNAFLLKTKDDIDNAITRMTDTVNVFKTKVDSATAADKEDLEKDKDDFEEHLDQLEKRVERLTSEGTLTEDAKKTYDDTIDKLKDDLDSAEEKLDKLS